MKAAKFLVALVGAALVTLISVLTDGHVTATEWTQVGIAVATGAGVWIAANVPTFTWAKTAVAVVLGVLSLLTSYVTDGISGAEWLNLALVALTAAGVYVVPNSSRAPAGVTGKYVGPVR
jgi:hypothetical protein